MLYFKDLMKAVEVENSSCEDRGSQHSTSQKSVKGEVTGRVNNGSVSAVVSPDQQQKVNLFFFVLSLLYFILPHPYFS